MLDSATPLRGVVFDLNGTLVDDIRFHFEAWRDLSAELGIELDLARFQSFNGQKNADIFPALLGRPMTAEEIEAIGEKKEAAYRALYRPHLALVAGARELLERLCAAGIPMAIASSSPPKNRAMVIDGLELGRWVTAIVEAEHLPGKPKPDVFLAAAARLGVPPEECLAFEDAVVGIRAATAARMLVGAITTNSPAEVLLGAGAHFAVPSFERMPDPIEARLFGAPRSAPAAKR